MFSEPKTVLALGIMLVAAGFTFGEDKKKETTAQRRERLAIAVQAVCPVSGESLTEHANPVKMVNQETKEVLYVCCESCLKEKPVDKHMATIRSNFAKAQGKCLVMSDNEITEKSKHGIVGGRFVYVCCPPCVKKMNAETEKFLSTLDDRYEAALKQK